MTFNLKILRRCWGPRKPIRLKLSNAILEIGVTFLKFVNVCSRNFIIHLIGNVIKIKIKFRLVQVVKFEC